MPSPPFTARAAILQVLSVPATGREIIRRVAHITRGAVRLHPGSVYPSLRRLQTEGLVRAAGDTRKGARRGRPGTVFELTLRGTRAAGSVREELRLLLAPRFDPAAAEPDVRTARLRLCAELSDEAMALRDQGSRRWSGDGTP